MIVNSILDKSIYFSFDQSGYHRHAKNFSPITTESLHFKRFLVTGGTSGIGESIVKNLLCLGAEALFTGRTLKSKTYENQFVELDLCCHDKVIEFAHKSEPLDGIVLNAGGMPTDYSEHHGYESQFASQVLGHFILLRQLMDLGKLNRGAQVVWMSSGGMYMVKYNHSLITNALEKYDKVGFYANAKRAQIILNDHLHQTYHSKLNVCFSVMHPGWVDTSGVRDAIPGFFNFTKNRLRTPDQGGDTALWLLSHGDNPSGEFWFDRKIQKKVVFPWTKNSGAEREQLIELCENYYHSICQN